MKISPFQRERLACSYFFAAPGLVYGIFTSRLPALKALTNSNDSDIGFLLLAFGAASFTGLLTSAKIMRVVGARALMTAACLVMCAAITVGALAYSYSLLVGCGIIAGFTGGLCEVAMNAQGITIEKRYNVLCMASLHACFSLGGATGSLTGSLFANLNLSPFLNFILILGAYLLLIPLAYPRVINAETVQKKEKSGKKRVPPIIYALGLMSMLCYVSEGSVGEWGSILLHSAKGAPQDQAALVFACFCVSMVIFRFLGDRMRALLGDLKLVVGGAALGAACMTFILLSSSPTLCLAAYAVMGMGFAPIVPILFSVAGKCGGVDPGSASTTMSIMSYTGLLVFPPLIGMAGDIIGLDRALWIIAVACVCVAASGRLLIKAKRNC